MNMIRIARAETETRRDARALDTTIVARRTGHRSHAGRRAACARQTARV